MKRKKKSTKKQSTKTKKKFSKRFFAEVCLLILLLIFIAAGVYKHIASAKPYNVLLISFDALRADSLNCYGFKKYVTSSNIDALADDGILFENCIVASPWTTPSHMSMLTSLEPSTHGITSSFIELCKGLIEKDYDLLKLPQSRITLAEALKADGFATAAFTGGTTVEPVIGFGQGFDLYDTSMYKLDQYNMNAMFDWIKQNSKRRFFLFWHNFEVHAPYLRGDFLSNVLGKETIELLLNEHMKLSEVSGHFSLVQAHQELLKRHNCFNKEVSETMYWGGVRFADQWLGRLIKLLRNKGLYDRTMIIFTSDHGEEFADRIQKDFYDKHGKTLYEEMVRAPLIIKLPYQQYAGTRVSQVSRIIDIMPTILNYLAVRPDKNEMQGVSLMPFCRKDASIPTQIAYTEALAVGYEQKSIRTDRYKFIISIDANTVSQFGRQHIPKNPSGRELYDLYQDPKEKINLLSLPHSKEIAKQAEALEQKLRRHISEQTSEIETGQLDTEMIRKLKSLGYIDD